MDRANAGADFHLGDWLVEPALNRVSRRQAVCHLRPRLTDLLVYLAEHAGEVVTKDDILEKVWQRRFVAESVLSRSIADLRRVLGDNAERPRFIETIAKRGYRLVAPVSWAMASVPAPPASRRSIVVLPFADLASARDQGYFCDGLAEELTNALANVPGLRVVARTTAFAFKDKGIDVREIGRQLGVTAVLEGGVQRSGERVRVTVQLVDTSDGCHIWSHRFDRPAGDVFAIEDEIADAVVTILQVRLLDRREARLVRGRTTNPAAHDLYLKARCLAARRSPDALRSAASHFELAIGADPNYAAAFAGLAECHVVSGFVGFAPPANAFPRARNAAEKALALDEDLADGYAVLGHETGMYEWRWQEAERHFRTAIALSPGSALARMWYSHLLCASGRFDEAIAEMERACECDPLSPTVQTTLGLAWYHAGEYERAIDRYLEVLAADPTFVLARLHLGRARASQGDFAGALEQYSKIGAVLPIAIALSAAASRRLGNAEGVREALAELDRAAQRCYVGPVVRACASIGDRDTNLLWFARAFDEHEGILPLLNTDPVISEVRADPAFRALFDRLRLPAVRDRRHAE